MRKARFTEEQMVAVIRESDREPVCRRSWNRRSYTWRKRFDGLQVNEARRLKQLERAEIKCARFSPCGVPLASLPLLAGREHGRTIPLADKSLIEILQCGSLVRLRAHRANASHPAGLGRYAAGRNLRQ